MALAPFVTFQLQATKKKEAGENFIKWKCPINEELLANGSWAIAINGINLNDAKEDVAGNFKKIRNAQVSVNLVQNDFKWYSKVRRFLSSSDYPEWHPILYTHFDMNENDLIFLSKTECKQKINHITSNLDIVLEPITSSESSVTMKHLSCGASVLISLYKC